MDIVDADTRSRMMAGIRGKDTGPEMKVRRALHAAGFRFRLHRGDLPGRPDILLPRHRAAVFIHGCFWHRHPGCRLASTPSSNAAFWEAKFSANVGRDAKNKAALLEAGWRVATVWECGLKRARADETFAALTAWLRGTGRVHESEVIEDASHSTGSASSA
jgi:DNA mismatch endonuclease (patch repair protein)